MKYIAAGNTMIDQIMAADGTVSSRHMGGPAPFACAGMRVFSDEVGILSNVGQDFDSVFGDWATNANINLSGVHRMTDYTHCFTLKYNQDGTYKADIGKELAQYHRELGYMEVTAKQFMQHTKGCEVLYFFYDCFNPVFWRQLGEAKRANGFKLMWEMSGASAFPAYLKDIKQIISDLKIEMFSLNWPETKNLFKTNDKVEGMRQLMSLGAPVVFFRDGTNGAYVIKGNSYWHFPMIESGRVDPTGCGHTSTGAFACAYHMTGDPVLAGAMANVAGSLNAAQYGVIPHFSAQQRSKAIQLAQKLVTTVKEKSL